MVIERQTISSHFFYIICMIRHIPHMFPDVKNTSKRSDLWKKIAKFAMS